MKYDETLSFALAYDAQRHSDGYAHQHGSLLYDYLRGRQQAKSRKKIERLDSEIVRQIRLREGFLPARSKSALIYPWEEKGASLRGSDTPST
jgi:hypothetical protein